MSEEYTCAYTCMHKLETRKLVYLHYIVIRGKGIWTPSLQQTVINKLPSLTTSKSVTIKRGSYYDLLLSCMWPSPTSFDLANINTQI